MTCCYFLTRLLLLPGFLAASWNRPAHQPPWSRWRDYLQSPLPSFPEAIPHPFLQTLTWWSFVCVCGVLRAPLCLPCGNCPSPLLLFPPRGARGIRERWGQLSYKPGSLSDHGILHPRPSLEEETEGKVQNAGRQVI